MLNSVQRSVFRWWQNEPFVWAWRYLRDDLFGANLQDLGQRECGSGRHPGVVQVKHVAAKMMIEWWVDDGLQCQCHQNISKRTDFSILVMQPCIYNVKLCTLLSSFKRSKSLFFTFHEHDAKSAPFFWLMGKFIRDFSKSGLHGRVACRACRRPTSRGAREEFHGMGQVSRPSGNNMDAPSCIY